MSTRSIEVLTVARPRLRCWRTRPWWELFSRQNNSIFIQGKRPWHSCLLQSSQLVSLSIRIDSRVSQLSLLIPSCKEIFKFFPLTFYSKQPKGVKSHNTFHRNVSVIYSNLLSSIFRKTLKCKHHFTTIICHFLFILLFSLSVLRS